MTDAMTDGDWQSVKDAAVLLEVSERTIWRRVERGELRIDRSVTPHLVDVSDAVSDAAEPVAEEPVMSVRELQAEVRRLESVLSEVRESLEDARRERDGWSRALERYMLQTERLLGAGDVVDAGSGREREEPVGVLARFGRWLSGGR